MSTVLQFRSFADPAGSPPRSSDTPARRRILIGSRLLAILFTILFAASALVIAAAIGLMLFYHGPLIRIGPDGCYIGGGPANSVAFGSLPIVHRLVYVVVALVRYGPVLMLFGCLRRLFGLYGRGQVFSAGAGIAFSHIGGWLCAYALSPLICHLVLSATGYELDKAWLHMASVQAFVLGLLVLVIGQVMQVGQEIDEDRQGFV